MTDTSALVAFIRARLGEDEAAAQACDQKIWHAGSAWAADLLNPLPSQRRDHPGYIPMITQADVDHIARHDPASVLREVEAKRQIMRMAELYADAQFPDHDGGYADAAKEAVAQLAAVWSDHPSYREEWRP